MWDLIVSVPDHCLSFYFSVGTRKGGVGYNRNDPNKIMYVLVGR